MRPDPEPPPEEQTPSLIDVLRILLSRRWLVAVLPLCITALVVGYSLIKPPEYEASVRILIGQEHQSDPLSSLSVGDLQQIIQTMVEAIRSRSIAEEVIQQLDLKMT